MRRRLIVKHRNVNRPIRDFVTRVGMFGTIYISRGDHLPQVRHDSPDEEKMRRQQQEQQRQL